jgi:hypothetical protein
MTFQPDINPDAEDSKRLMNALTSFERKKLRWQGFAMIWGVPVPEGVNPQRLKKYRRKTARERSRQERLLKRIVREPKIHDFLTTLSRRG